MAAYGKRMTIENYNTIDESELISFVNGMRKDQQDIEREINLILASIQSRKPKLCLACRKPKGEVSFHKNNQRRDGLQAYCTNCMKNKRLEKESQPFQAKEEF